LPLFETAIILISFSGHLLKMVQQEKQVENEEPPTCLVKGIITIVGREA
jgi:hypothetical protein